MTASLPQGLPGTQAPNALEILWERYKRLVQAAFWLLIVGMFAYYGLRYYEQTQANKKWSQWAEATLLRSAYNPKSDDDADGWNAVYNRLGRPESADKYGLPVPEGDDGSFAQAAAPVLHELGLTTKQAKGLAEWWNQASSTRIEAADEAFSKQSEAEYSALKGEWGAAAAQNEELAKRAVLKFGKEAGLDEASFDSLERAIGTAKVMKLFHAIGAKFGEADFVGSDTPSSGALTPAQAKNKVASLFADQEFMGRYMHQDQRVRQSAIEEMMALNRMANPGVTEE